jgi:hypothetical protein
MSITLAGKHQHNCFPHGHPDVLLGETGIVGRHENGGKGILLVFGGEILLWSFIFRK